MRILFCGDRNWIDQGKVIDAFIKYQPTVVIEGQASGADLMSRVEAEKRGITVLPFPADWARYGRAAGPIRNRQMLEEGKPELVVAFHSNISASKGTANMVRQAERAGIKVVVIT